MSEMIVDRIEKTDDGYYYVCETDDGTCSVFSKDKLAIKTGDVVTDNNGILVADKKKTEERRKKIIALQNDLFE